MAFGTMEGTERRAAQNDRIGNENETENDRGRERWLTSVLHT